MKEYGGYIEFEYFYGKEFHDKAIALNSGRHSVEYIIRAKNIIKLYLPYFMCDSISNLCKKLNVEIEYYHIDINFTPCFNKDLKENEWLYIVNFYGQLSNKIIRKFKKKYYRIILDNAQAFFCKPIKGIDTCYTCRKFFGVTDGGYLYTDTQLKEELQKDCSYDRMQFLFGRMDKNANEFYSQYVSNNKLFAKEPLKKMSRVTQNLMRGLDYKKIKKKRTENFKFLHKQLRNINKLKLTVPKGAFMYPLYIENGVEIRKKFQEKKIYIPTLWSNVFELCNENDLEYNMAKNILPLPIDQRYIKKEICFIIKEITKCIS